MRIVLKPIRPKGNCRLCSGVLTIKLAAQLPNWLWDELAEAMNKVDAALPVPDNPHGAPQDALITGTQPDASGFKVLGCLGFVHTPAGTLEPKALQGTVVGYARKSVGLRVLMTGVHYRDKRAIVESNSVICHEGIRGVNGTSSDCNIIITTTEGFDDLGVWRRPHEAHHEVPIQRPRVVTFADPAVPEQSVTDTEVNPNTSPEPGHLTVMTDEPVAVMMDQHLEDRDLADS